MQRDEPLPSGRWTWLTVRVPQTLHGRVKREAALQGVTMQELVKQLLEARCP
jgi:predicted HicB family RNase H-like nuclease